MTENNEEHCELTGAGSVGTEEALVLLWLAVGDEAPGQQG